MDTFNANDRDLEKRRKAASTGNPDAVFQLALYLHDSPTRCPEWKDECIHHYRRLVKQLYPPAMNNLAVLLLEPYPYVSRPTFQEALSLFKKSSSFGNHHASKVLAQVYLSGKYGFEKDIKKAVALLKKAVCSGHVPSMQVLAQAVLEGTLDDGSTKSSAIELLQDAVLLNDVESMLYLADVYFKGKHGVKEDRDEALKLYRRAASTGDENAMFRLAYRLQHLPNDSAQIREECIKLYHTLVAKSYGTAMNNLSNVLLKNDPAVSDEVVQEALELYRKSSNQGCDRATRNLAIIHLKGKYGMKNNVAEAISLLEKAACNGHIPSMKLLAKTMVDGKHNDKSKDSTLVEKTEIITTLKNVDVMLSLAQMLYEPTHGIRESKDVALKLFRQAADTGDEEAVLRLGFIEMVEQNAA